MDFNEQKEKQLSREDKSNIGSIDSKIEKLLELINSKNEYYTTSSCSGRVVLIKLVDEKAEDVFLFRTHDLITFNQLKKELESISYRGLVEFKMTSCILHVACKSLEDALLLVDKAKKSGWKHSGVMDDKRNMVELMSTESISFPVVNDKKLLVDDEFLELIVSESNKKLERVWEKIERLENII